MKKMMTALSAIVAVSACAQQPTSIAPAEVSRSGYAGASCNSLRTELYETETKLGQLSAAQSAEASKDAAWVAGGLLLWPAASVAARRLPIGGKSVNGCRWLLPMAAVS